MSLLTRHPTPPLRERFHRLLAGVWIALLLGGLFTLAVADFTIIAYVLEKLTTHAGYSLKLKQIASPHREEYHLLLGTAITASAALGALSGVIGHIVVPHWRIGVLAAVLVLVPALAAGALSLFWHATAPELFEWGVRHILLLAGTQAISALLGACIGGPPAALLIRALLPPRWRPV